MSPAITVEKVMLLKDFPSGSSLEFFENKFYLIGDDATYLSILNVDYKEIDSILLFKSAEKRIPKADKTDFEASAVIGTGREAQMFVFGSASTELRKKVGVFTIHNAANTFNIINIAAYIKRLQTEVSIVNIEGAATVKNQLLLANRANAGNPINYLIVTDATLIHNPETASYKVVKFDLPKQENVVGISGLTYFEKLDLLLFTASTEFTGSAYEDGKIGDSYIGLIKNISKKLTESTIKPDQFINLLQADPVFKGEKIESICVQDFKNNTLTLHLVSDNDNGQSTLYKIQLPFKE